MSDANGFCRIGCSPAEHEAYVLSLEDSTGFLIQAQMSLAMASSQILEVTIMEVERRSIEFVPHEERYGTPRRLFTIWFSSNVQVTALMVGTLGIVAGLSFFWTVVALFIGIAIGTVFMAAHSAQGPHLGIPQMIQSRAQFGVIGAAIPLLMVVLSAVLFVAASGVLLRESIKAVVPLTDNLSIVLVGFATLLIGFMGYELIHRVGAWMTVLSTMVFVGALGILLLKPETWSALQAGDRGFSIGAFNLVIAQAASWGLGYGPYVADYSRYLPANVKTSDTFWSTYLGCGLGSFLIMTLGALFAITLPTIMTGDPGTSISSLFEGYGKLVLVIIVIGVVEYNVLCLYSAYMSSVTIFSGMNKMTRVGRGVKFVIMLALSSVATMIAIKTQYDFNAYFSDILVGQLYLIVPWSAINLVDYYLVRCGRYSIADMYEVKGEYGRFNVLALTVYLVSIILTIPFMDLSFFKGSIALAIGADISWMPALVVPGLLYYVAFMGRRKTLVGVK